MTPFCRAPSFPHARMLLSPNRTSPFAIIAGQRILSRAHFPAKFSTFSSQPLPPLPPPTCSAADVAEDGKSRRNVAGGRRIDGKADLSPAAHAASNASSGKSVGLGASLEEQQRIQQYILQHTREPQVLADLRLETSTMTGKEMQVSRDQGAFLAMLVRLTGARNCIEVGVFTGYSAVAMALALPEGGRLVACDRVPHTMGVAQKYFELAGVQHKVDVRLGLANETLGALIHSGEQSTFDLAFLDADKRAYPGYYEQLLALLRPGGLLVVDNVLWHGKVAQPPQTVNDAKTESMRNFNRTMLHDPRIDFSLVSIGDGMALCRKRHDHELPPAPTLPRESADRIS